MPNLVGQELGRYRLVELLGRGGMATVYKAFDSRLERYVAVKVIDSRLDDPSFLKRFEREAKSLARLSHTNIVKVHDYGEENGLPYLVMEFVPSGSLKSLLGKPMPYQKAIGLLLPIARALQYAHKLGIVHRDVKPGNILIDAAGQPMLSDFGIAKMMEAPDSTSLTGTGVGIGTPEYMAPEQGQGVGVDQRADIYALGIVLCELITGRTPYQADTPMAVVLKHMLDPLPPISQLAEGIPPEVEAVIHKALAKRPEDRYQDMGEFASCLEELLQRTKTLQDVSLTRTVEETQAPKLKTSSAWMLWGGLGGVVFIGVLLALVVAIILLSRVQWGTVLGTTPYLANPQESEAAVNRNVRDIEKLINGYVPPMSPKDVDKPFHYEINLNYSEPLIWNLSWCADSKALLDDNLKKMRFSLQINQKEIPQDRRAEKYFTYGGNPCYAVYTLLDKWPKGTFQLFSAYQFLEDVNDGWETYPPGSISYTHTVHVASNALAPVEDVLGCVNTFDTATLSILAGMKPVLCTNFEQGDNRWISEDDDEYARTSSKLDDGALEYRIDAKKGVYFHPTLPLRSNPLMDEMVFDNFGISITARRRGTSSEGMYGVYFRETDNEMFVFEINDTAQTYSVYMPLPGTWRPIKESTSNPHIKPGDWNTITMKANVEQFVFYINGQPAYTFVDSRLPRGGVGLAMEMTNPNESEVFEFDKLLLVAP